MVVHDVNCNAVQIRGKTGLIAVQAQIIAVDARQPNQLIKADILQYCNDEKDIYAEANNTSD